MIDNPFYDPCIERECGMGCYYVSELCECVWGFNSQCPEDSSMHWEGCTTDGDEADYTLCPF